MEDNFVNGVVVNMI